MKSLLSLVSFLLLSACATPSEINHEPGGVGWSVDGTLSGGPEDGGFLRYIISGPPDVVDEFTRDARADGWLLEARGPASAELVFAQFRAPIRLDQTTSFMDRYLIESPRRLNIAGAVSKAETP